MTPPSPPATADATAPASSPLPLLPWMAGLAALTTLATLRTLLLPPFPEAGPLPAQRSLQAVLDRAGLQAVALPSEPAKRDVERSLSQGLVWRLADGQILRLRHGGVRRWEAFQLAAITGGVPELALQRRRLATDAMGAPIALGAVKGDHAMQSCLVPGASAALPLGVTLDQLPALVGQRPNPPALLAARLLGLRPMRSYDCVVISLQAPGGGGPSPATWERLVRALAPLLVVEPHGSPSL